MMYDFSAFTGHWPYRRLRRAGLLERLEDNAAHGIGGGLLSSLDAVFYHDAWEADAPLLTALHGSSWHLAMSVNPLLPWSRLAVVNGARAGARAIRLYPGIHCYSLEDSSVLPLCRIAGTLGIAVAITGRLEDKRLEYLLHQEDVAVDSVLNLAEKCPETQFLLTNFYLDELASLSCPPENLWADTAGLCHGLFPFEHLTFPASRVLFGSCAPLQSLDSALLNLPEDQRNKILSENARGFLGVLHV